MRTGDWPLLAAAPSCEQEVLGASKTPKNIAINAYGVRATGRFLPIQRAESADGECVTRWCQSSSLNLFLERSVSI